ncbi:MAG: AMIN domain-containing protein [Deltaproteobacteria bacterium]|nr:AMIN domain-containing protein [Deltaproteobacteria bacterium]
MRKYVIIVVLGMVFLLSGCFLSQTGKSMIEIEQSENPMIWKEVYKVEATLWPLEGKVNKIEQDMNTIRNELATAKLSSIQANKGIEALQAEIEQIKSESIAKGKTSLEQPLNENTKEETEKTKVVREDKKAGTDIQSTINDIQYDKISDTHDRVLIYINSMNNPKLQTLRGENPRIVLDFLNSHYMDKKIYKIHTDGNFIKKIRIGAHKEPVPKVRVVFDMMPNKKYSVHQEFSKEDHVYSFDVKSP